MYKKNLKLNKIITSPLSSLTENLPEMGSLTEVSSQMGILPFSHEEITLVTAFFDLPRREPHRPRKTEEYLELCQHVLDLPVNLFIVADPEQALYIWQERKKRGLLGKSFIYPLELENSPYYQYHSEVEKCFKGSHQPKLANKRKDTPLYIIMGWTRFFVVEQAIKLNPFDSKGFVWIDFGIFHLAHEVVPKGLINQEITEMKSELFKILGLYPQDKIKILQLEECHQDELKRREEYYSEIRFKLAAGLFGGPKDLMLWFSQEVDKEIKECLAIGHPTWEEAIMNYIYTFNKSKFDIYYGNYYDLVINFRCYRRCVKVIMSNLDYCRRYALWSESMKICQYITYSIENKIVNYTPKQLVEFYDKYLIAAWYFGDKETSYEAGKKLTEVFSNKQAHQSFNSNEIEHYNNNLRFLNLEIIKDNSS